MSLSAKIRRAPLRAVTGAYILNSGVGKLTTDDDTAKTVHDMASNTYGFVANMQPRSFARTLGAGEIAVGSALLLPIVSPVIAGAALVGYSGALLNMYWRTPGLHQEGNPRPTAAGGPLAKDAWLLGIGTGLVADGMLEPAHDKRVQVGATVAEKRAATSRRTKRKAAKAAKTATAATKRTGEHTAQAKAMLTEALTDAQERAAKRAERAAKRAKRAQKRAKKSARKASDSAAKRLADLRADYVSSAGEKAAQARDATKHATQQAAAKAQDIAAKAQDAATHAQDAAARVKERVAS